MSIFRVKNGLLERKDAAAASQLIAVDTDNILGGGAGADTDAQALFDGIAGELGSLDTAKQPKTLSTPLTIDGTSQTTVEGALGGLNDYADALDGGIDAIVNVYGSKNLLQNKGAYMSVSGVTFKHNSDDSITVNGTATANVSWNINKSVPLKANTTYTVSTNVTGNARIVISAWSGSTYVRNLLVLMDDATSGSFTATYADYDTIRATVYVASGATVSNVTLYPMIRDARIKDSSYEPYVLTNKAAMSLCAEQNRVLGAKNLWSDNIDLSNNVGGTHTKTSDGFDIQCTTTANSGCYFGTNVIKNAFLQYGKIVFSCEYKSDIACNSTLGEGSGIPTVLPTEWTPYEETIDVNTHTYIVFYNKDTSQAPKISLRNIMVRIAADPDSTYAPYAMTNQQLTDTAKVLAPLTYEKGTTLTSGDLNNIKTPGIYAYTGGNAGSITNKPPGYSTAAIIYVIKEWDDYFRQILMLRDNPKIATRVYASGNGWSHWWESNLTDLGA